MLDRTKGEVMMNVLSELDTLCIVARQAYGSRGVVLASSNPWCCVASPIDVSAMPSNVEDMVPHSALDFEAAEIVFSHDELFPHEVEPT